MTKSHGLASRLREVRIEMYGEHGAPLLAKALRIPTRTWVNYESGDRISGPILLRFFAVTGVGASWLLSGEGRKYRPGSSRSGDLDHWN
jgi:hypothetical protein